MTSRKKSETLGSRALEAWLIQFQPGRSAFAESVGVSPSTITRWASGEARPKDSIRHRIAKMTGGQVPVWLWSMSVEREEA